jgi:hypothetical protein
MLREAFIAKVKQTPLIVIGYSGRDASIMQMFRDAYSAGGSAPIYWCGFGDAAPMSEVEDLLDKARSTGRNAYFVPSEGR